MATLGTEESGHCREVQTRANVWLSANKSGVGESSTVLLTALGDRDSEKNFLRTSGRLLTDCTLFIAKGGGGTSF